MCGILQWLETGGCTGRISYRMEVLKEIRLKVCVCTGGGYTAYTLSETQKAMFCDKRAMEMAPSLAIE